VPRIDQVGLDVRVVAFTALAAAVTAAVCGALPAFQSAGIDLARAAKEGGDRAATAGRAVWTSNALIVGQIALTVVLLASAGLLAHSFLELQRVDPGFAREHVTELRLYLPMGRYPDIARQSAAYGRLLDGLAGQRVIEAAAVAFPDPINANNAAGRFEAEGQDPGAERPRANIASVSPGYFQTLRVPLLAGRGFTEQDTGDTPSVAIVSQTLAARAWPGQSPLGRRLRFGAGGDDWITVVGMAADVRGLGLDAPPAPTMYLPYRQWCLPFTNLYVRGPAAGAVSTVRTELRRVDPELAIGRVATLEDVLAQSVAQPRFRTALLSILASVALLLAAVGIYGVISYSVGHRLREIGIRLALGASPRQVLEPILRHGVTLAAIGLGIGLAGALAAGRLLSSFLFGIGAADLSTLSAVSLLLLVVAIAATYVPARRAMKVDPIEVLRN
jgi:putative ABC transport system permease protein